MTQDLEKKLVTEVAELPTSRAGRLWRMGRTAARVGTSLLGGGPSASQSEAIRRMLGKLKGLSMKAGQKLSYVDERVPPELRQALKVLQQAAQASPWPAVEAQLRTALGAHAEPLLRVRKRKIPLCWQAAPNDLATSRAMRGTEGRSADTSAPLP